MTDPVSLRPAKPNEIDALTDICLRSKAHWGYDVAFMEKSRDALTIKPERVQSGDVVVAELHGRPAGVAAIAPDEDGYEIEVFFVDPNAMGKGVGAHLFQALVSLAAKRGITQLTIASDPNAAAFYEKMGARPIGSVPSESMPGRRLPLLKVDIAKALQSNARKV